MHKPKRVAAKSSKNSKKPKKTKKTLRDLNIEQEAPSSPRRRKGEEEDENLSPASKKKHGSGMISTEMMCYDRNKRASYMYWDDPNELVDRLRSPHSQPGHTNEIVSIIEELREADIIT